jgi:hypothetical protein
MGLSAVLVAMAGCGGGNGGGFVAQDGGGTGIDECSLDGQKAFVLDVMRDIYFWNTDLPDTVDLSQFDTPEELLDFLTSFQPLDRFSFIDSAEADRQFFDAGEFAGFGFSTRFVADADLRFTRVFSGSPAAAAGFERGQRILEVDGRTIQQILDDGDFGTVFGPEEVGVVRNFRIRRTNGTEYAATVTKAVVTIDPVPRVTTFDVSGVPVGYIKLASFIGTAEAPLDQAFAQFNAAGINDLILDLRYNGGGLVRVAELLGDYLGGRVSAGEVFSRTLYNADNSNLNSVELFDTLTQSMSLSRLVVITGPGTASASEVVINSMEPSVEVTLIGSDTFGKPVGQVGVIFCEKILRPTAFETVNSLDQGGYFDGLPVDCPAVDDLNFAIGTPLEPATAEALAFLGTGACSPSAFTDAAKPVADPAVVRQIRGGTTAQVFGNVW